ncbi:MAG: M24 family metallopeptidase [Lachnospiraceae bacterium]|nr:M24 family metallopeptidase [Lachnospiraceae bacterium]
MNSSCFTANRQRLSETLQPGSLAAVFSGEGIISMMKLSRPGMKMKDVDATIRSYNAERLMEAGVMTSADQIGTYMWHGGAHHIGYDVHDVIETPEVLAPGMVFCVDVGIYHEEWGIGFRLEDNCLVTEDGCENLSAAIPRTIEEIEAVMAEAR